jgi:outer membrane protein assembly factor BamB
VAHAGAQFRVDSLVNRGAAYAAGRIFYNTLDAHTVAVDAASGKELWKARVGDVNQGETVTMAPLVVKGKVLVGNSGGEMGVRGWLTALDANTGELAWRAYHTGPDKWRAGWILVTPVRLWASPTR